MGVKIDRGHKARLGRVRVNLRGKRVNHAVGSDERMEMHTQPSVIKLLSSVKLITNSSSSIVQVSLVECCFGINSVVTTNLLFLSFPNNSPQVSLFRAVLTAATLRNLGSDSRGR